MGLGKMGVLANIVGFDPLNVRSKFPVFGP